FGELGAPRPAPASTPRLGMMVVARRGRGNRGDTHRGDGDGARDPEELPCPLAAEHADEEEHEWEDLSRGDAHRGSDDCKRLATRICREIVARRDRSITLGPRPGCGWPSQRCEG